MQDKRVISRASGFIQTVFFTCTILVSAFLLFWVQPLFAKMILPILGGSSSVWTTSMLFFQFTLLAGYVYAHFSGEVLGTRPQILLHIVLLSSALLSLPFYIDFANSQSPEGSPAFWVLSFAALTVGLPFFIVSATAPMLQRWFSLTHHKDRDNPYFLYAASNLGCLAALFCFPMVFEPSLGVRLQTTYWQAVFYVLVALFVITGLVTFGQLDTQRESMLKKLASRASCDREISANRRLCWVFLAFIPSSMMLGLTSHVTTDIAPVSMFWIVPLACYLLSFVIVFSRWQHLIPNRGLAIIIMMSTAALLILRVAGFEKTGTTALISIGLNVTLFFASAWLFHGYLSSTRPSAAHLTEFYLWMSIGGMFGGLFNALVAPVIFNQIFEYYAVIVSIFFFSIKLLVDKSAPASDQKNGETVDLAILFGIFLFLLLVADMLMSQPITAKVKYAFLAGTIGLLLIAWAVAFVKRGRPPLRIALYVVAIAAVANFLVLTRSHSNLLLARSFYGSLQVKFKQDKNSVPYHLLIHGSTMHNLQNISAPSLRKPEPLMYYHRQANIGNAVSSLKALLHRPMHLGFVGLGAGAMGAYLEENDTATFYEIDPEVVAIAKNQQYFNYLSDAKGKVEIIVGDARLQIKKAADHVFDIILVDAFSSDSIPVHLLTAEALEIYLHKLKDDGILLFHLSNRYLELKKVMQGFQLPKGYVLYYADKNDVEEPTGEANNFPGVFSHSQVALIAKEAALPENISSSKRWRKLEHDPDFRYWTDDFSNVLSVFRFGGVE